MKMQVGDSVRIKDGVKHADMPAIAVGGWQGRIHTVDSYEHGDFADIQLDSQTLMLLSNDYIVDSEREGVFWQRYSESIDNIELVNPRDTPDDVSKTITRIRDQFEDDYYMDAEREMIKQIMGDIEPHSEEAIDRWYAYLKKQLKLPFVAVVDSYSFVSPHDGQTVRVIHLEKRYSMDDGLIVKCRKGTKRMLIPLHDLRTKAADAPESYLLRTYSAWYRNQE